MAAKPPPHPVREQFHPAPTATRTDDEYYLPGHPTPVARHNFNVWVNPDTLADVQNFWACIEIIENDIGRCLK